MRHRSISLLNWLNKLRRLILNQIFSLDRNESINRLSSIFDQLIFLLGLCLVFDFFDDQTFDGLGCVLDQFLSGLALFLGAQICKWLNDGCGLYSSRDSFTNSVCGEQLKSVHSFGRWWTILIILILDLFLLSLRKFFFYRLNLFIFQSLRNGLQILNQLWIGLIVKGGLGLFQGRDGALFLL